MVTAAGSNEQVTTVYADTSCLLSRIDHCSIHKYKVMILHIQHGAVRKQQTSAFQRSNINFNSGACRIHDTHRLIGHCTDPVNVDVPTGEERLSGGACKCQVNCIIGSGSRPGAAESNGA